MSEEKNVPNIRFKGFTDPWEQRKLGDVSSKVTEKNKSKKYTETLTNSAEYGIINQYAFFDKSISNSNSIASYYVVKRDNFVYNPRISTAAPVGPINRNRLNIIGIMSPLYYVFEATNIDKSYLEYYFKTTKWHNFMKIEGNTGARSDRLAIKDKVLVKMPIPYPKVKEQKQIGELFESIDTTIALHQQKVTQLKELKKLLMQKIFDQEWRFRGFTDPWEQRKLGSAYEITMGQSPNSNNYTKNPNDFILVQGNADIKNGRVVPRMWTKQITKLANPGDIILSVRAPVGDVGITNYTVVLGRGVASISGDDFIYQTLIKMKTFGFWRKFSTGSTFESINSKDIKNAVILVPIANERRNIGTIFKSVDATIALHQQKVDQLKELKKYLMQNLFV
ncbi:restriction endonuclease subunit S [Pediococcus acidilactici]|uniref:restriction endonuclease subunit S n=1 Tax=Pediococcus acidilactici TaxID=1254 RepID=UPI0013632E18|nr:restriction endonuclease subunit S [Pediococcus acidilactici]MCB5723425.1 restriction endonuclease subunit S [Pediococcus acidilactici]MCB5730084.1 restriction endonuclease subunit S [Pediococcus acidilactici]MCB5731840.1 restriction endonuclease subunit S [Pediococcus acidilactici]MCB5764795.1 restriction endonuclease subunit S [Pediococcus acidilactici]MCB5773820.1 restriction endonuclease subunit S [Pediococcus acidilactici]